MIEFALGAAVGAVVTVAFPPVNAYAVKLRDWLYGLFRKPDDTDQAGA